MMKDIKFFPKSDEVEMLVPPPKPARHYLPEWYKKLPAFNSGSLQINEHGEANPGPKMCVPFADSLSFGYIQETWCDIYFELNEEGNLRYSFSGRPQIIGHREENSITPSDDFYDAEFVWSVQWVPQLPNGYSVLYTSPLNRWDLPFYTLSGVVDSDKFKYEMAGNSPVFFKKGFSGMIPKGTPMYQIIPFKRDDWKSKILEHDEKQQLLSHAIRQYFWGGYKKLFWSKKTFK